MSFRRRASVLGWVAHNRPAGAEAFFCAGIMFNELFKTFAAPMLTAHLGGPVLVLDGLEYEVITPEAERTGDTAPGSSELEREQHMDRVEIDVRIPEGHKRFTLKARATWDGKKDWTLLSVSGNDGIFARLTLTRGDVSRYAARGVRQ